MQVFKVGVRFCQGRGSLVIINLWRGGHVLLIKSLLVHDVVCICRRVLCTRDHFLILISVLGDLTGLSALTVSPTVDMSNWRL